ncbi:hypothetical protein FCM35_KLT20765 [Carex littledalei]|uniref:Uncharacterized protein n=1 Tax=Carex littledalei TaxID=544730 RepID=A0A833RDP2_9POAL|nr:hypothetical protein FCM35_KLT20765 [Carex littledalei]
MNKGPPKRCNSSGMSQQASEGGPRSGQACVCIITCLLFVLLVTGGVFLVMFISLPASSVPSWLLPAGMALVASPWIFWIFTCIYRCIALRIAYTNKFRAEDRPSSQRQVTRQATVVVATDAPQQQVVEEEAVDSPGGARKVRFGDAIVLGNNSDVGDEEKGKADEPGTRPTGRAEGEGISRDGGESSTASRESEAPLALSMSS